MLLNSINYNRFKQNPNKSSIKYKKNNVYFKGIQTRANKQLLYSLYASVVDSFKAETPITLKPPREICLFLRKAREFLIPGFLLRKKVHGTVASELLEITSQEVGSLGVVLVKKSLFDTGPTRMEFVDSTAGRERVRGIYDLLSQYVAERSLSPFGHKPVIERTAFQFLPKNERGIDPAVIYKGQGAIVRPDGSFEISTPSTLQVIFTRILKQGPILPETPDKLHKLSMQQGWKFSDAPSPERRIIIL
jgi:hypothetical protein